MKKKTKQTVKKRGRTWTFQPADEVALMVERIMGPDPRRGALTRLINKALREFGGDVAHQVIDEEIAKLQAMKSTLGKNPASTD